ncbi:hypothetical protein [uncultured Polaribacter sp.]|uniref:hypothetical protein n=1 Tax=uncultured Polaribacter sp. TaxID=174711 RepID=UPI00260FE92D|nr:hypothetical protein [uncultured Polaribacter sp.]
MEIEINFAINRFKNLTNYNTLDEFQEYFFCSKNLKSKIYLLNYFSLEAEPETQNNTLVIKIYEKSKIQILHSKK